MKFSFMRNKYIDGDVLVGKVISTGQSFCILEVADGRKFFCDKRRSMALSHEERPHFTEVRVEQNPPPLDSLVHFVPSQTPPVPGKQPAVAAWCTDQDFERWRTEKPPTEDVYLPGHTLSLQAALKYGTQMVMEEKDRDLLQGLEEIGNRVSMGRGQRK